MWHYFKNSRLSNYSYQISRNTPLVLELKARPEGVLVLHDYIENLTPDLQVNFILSNDFWYLPKASPLVERNWHKVNLLVPIPIDNMEHGDILVIKEDGATTAFDFLSDSSTEIEYFSD